MADIYLSVDEIPHDLLDFFEPIDTGAKTDVFKLSTAPYSGSHFATFPPALVEPCIKAGTSEEGCCPVCGEGWVRVTKVERKNHKSFDHPLRTGNVMSGGVGKNFPETSREMVGWKPNCKCSSAYDGMWVAHDDPAYVPYDPIPCVVFDPFAGSGTTLLVARKLGRNGVGLDLSFSYLLDQARSRLELDLLDDWEYGKKVVDSNIDDLPLFGSLFGD